MTASNQQNEKNRHHAEANAGADGANGDRPNFDEVIAQLADIECPVTRDHETKKAAQRLKVTTAALRKAVEKRAAELRGEHELTEAAKVIRQVEPWPDVVDGCELADAIRSAFNRYLNLPEYADVILTLWVIASHVIDAFPKFPYIILTSAEPNCGKSEVLKVLRHLLQRAALASGMTGAVIFRIMNAYKPALLMDETDQWLGSDEGQSINSVINGAHDKETAVIWRCVGDDHEPTPFNTWGAKAFSGIGARAKTLSSRGHIITMMRAPPHAVYVELESDDDKSALQVLARRAVRFAQDHEAELGERPSLPQAVSNRDKDNWRPLFAVAHLIGGHWPELVKTAAEHAIAEAKEYADDSLGLKLIRDCIDVIKTKGLSIDGDRELKSSTLRDQLVKIADAPWAEYRNGKPISPRSLADLLRPYKIVTRKRKAANYWRLSQFERAYKAFVQAEGCQEHPDNPPRPSTVPFGQSNQSDEAWKKAEMSFHENSIYPPHANESEKWSNEWSENGGRADDLNNW